MRLEKIFSRILLAVEKGVPSLLAGLDAGRADCMMVAYREAEGRTRRFQRGLGTATIRPGFDPHDCMRRISSRPSLLRGSHCKGGAL